MIRAKGIVARITGRILGPNGRPIPEARVEIWQCDANGRYHYVRDGGGDRPRDENFQGYGAATTDPSGGYQFLTIKPVPYPGRTPHIHFAVSGRGFERFITQMYLAGEPRNTADPLLMGVRDPAARNRLIVTLHPVQGSGPAALPANSISCSGSPSQDAKGPASRRKPRRARSDHAPAMSLKRCNKSICEAKSGRS
jgi:protocatechuate 3,4-dioxygenase beta subunit